MRAENKKAAWIAPGGYYSVMSYLIYKFWKLIALVIIVFLLGCFNLLPTGERREKPLKPPPSVP